MKTQLNSLNRTANTTKISGEGNSHILKCLLTILLLLTLGVGEMWADVWIRGDMNNWENSDDWKFNDGKLEVSLEANTDYTFKVWDEVSYGNDHYRSYDLNGGKITGTIVKYNLDKDNVADYNLVLHTDEAGTYIFQYAYEDSKYKLSIYFPKARLQKQKYVYFDARRLTGSNSDYWQRGDFTARFYFKYYDSGVDNGNLDCTHANALEDWVYYVLVPNHDYIGQIQLNRLQVETEALCVANIAHAKDRPSSLENCLQEESGKEDYCNAWTPQWTTYCPPMSSVSLSDNGTTNWGGDGSSADPYLVPTDASIEVQASEAVSVLDDDNMTVYYRFKKEGTEVQAGSATATATITASSTTGTKEAVTVEAYNYYNSTSGTSAASFAIYYETRTPYTISYNKGIPSASISGSRESEIKLKDVAFTLPGAIFTRTGYTQTGWATSDGGAKAYELSASYTDNAALALYPVWTPKSYTVTLEGMEADSDDPIMVNVTYDAELSSPVSGHTKEHYDFRGYWTDNNDAGATLVTQLIDDNYNWKKNISTYTSDDETPKWIYPNDLSLFAKWEEIKYDVAVSVSPAEAGSVQVGGGAISKIENIGFATHSPVLTAVPSNAAWVFKEWRVSDDTKLHLDLKNYSKFDETMEITATDDGQKLTAVFEPRYTLVGSLTEAGDPEGGMPGWTDPNADAKAFAVNSTTPSLQMTKTCTLNPNSWYKFEVHDREANKNYGYGEGTSVISGSQQFNTQDRTVILQTKGRGEYTFTISAITESGGKYYPTVSVSEPTSHCVTIKWADVDIDGNWWKTSRATGGTVSAVATEGEDENPIVNGQYVAEGGSITYTATPATGYSFGGWWNGGDWNTEFSNTNPITSSSISSAQDYEAKFVETSTSVTLANDGHGKVQINSTDQTSTTCGVTTTRELTAVPNSGYSFSSWSKTGSDISLSATNTNPTTLTGGGSGASSQSVTANFSANNYTITLDDKHGGTTSASVTYDATSLTSISHASFEGWNLLGYWNTDGNKVIEANGDIVANVVNYTGSSGEWNYANNVTLYAHWSRSIALDKKEGSSNGSVTVTYKGIAGTPSAPSRSGYTVEGYYAETGLTTKVMNPNGTLVANVSGYTNSSSEWIHGTAAILYTKWTANEYIVTLNNLEATTAGTESVTATYDATLSAITIPTKAHYDFGGYWTERNGSGSQLIDTTGAWMASVDGYTDANRNWLYVDTLTLYAHWTPKSYTVTLEGMEADGESLPISVNVTYDAELPELKTKHTKAHYDLLGYWAASDDKGEHLTDQLIDANGNWIPDVAGYTGNDGEGHPTWIHDGINISLFADWTEHPYTVTTSVSPAGAGTLSCGSSVTAKWVTPTELITATPNPAWKFVRWEYSANVGPVDGTGLDNTVQIKAAVDGTLTAVFEPRFCLVGSIWDDSGNGGMPGWHDYTADFIVNSYTDLSTMNLTCVRSLDPNTTYKFEVHDKVKGQNFGYSSEGTYIADQSLLFNTQNNDVLLRVNGYGECTFTISALSDGDLYPTVSVAIPASHQLNLEWAYVRINGDWYKTSDDVGGTVSAQTTESGRHFDIHNGEYVANGGAITYTATPATGYTFEGWYNNNYNNRFSTTNPFTSENISETQNVEAKFVEKATEVTLSNDGHGRVEINDKTVSSTTVGVTTTRELTAVPNEGYKFNSWTIVSGNDIALSSTLTNPTTLYGLGAGAASGQEVRANFIERWIVQPEVGEWGYEYFTIEHIEEVGGKTIGYVDITLEANTNYQFSVVDRDGDVKYKNGSNQVYYMTNGNSHNWGFATDKSFYCGITTAGAGVYRFTWNITDKKMTVTYPNFVIYRTGDKADDPRAQNTDVESYDGGLIEKAIEYRMKVNKLDFWYTLCLPFTVTAVKVWDEEDGAYYDIVPYYRTGGKFYTGHYVIRTPVSTTNFAIENFDSRERWTDPSSPDNYLPSKNTPYIIQWHDEYFLDKYISFFGTAGQTIPTAMDEGSYASLDETVNIYGNNCMTSGKVRDAYMLDSDYGSGGAWMREEIGTYRSVLPFECFILANEKTTAKYRVLRRDMADNTPTGLDTLSKTEDTASKVLINNHIYIIRGGKMYTIQGTFVKEVE